MWAGLACLLIPIYSLNCAAWMKLIDFGTRPGKHPRTGSFDDSQRISVMENPPNTPNQMSLSESDERTWAMLAHLSVLANLVTGFLGPIAALVIYLVYKDRSRYIAYHAMQAFVFQLIWWVGGGLATGIAWAISGALVAVVGLGCLLMPGALIISLIPLASLIYGVVGAVQCSQGQDFRYWLVGDWTRKTLEDG